MSTTSKFLGDDRSKVVVDADGLAQEGFGIQADNVTVERLTVRNAEDGGIVCVGSGCSVRNVRVDGDTATECVSINGDGAVVSGSSIVGCNSDGILVEGTSAQIRSNTVRLIESVCIAVIGGENTLIQSNTIQNCTNQGIFVGGDSDNTRVDRNSIKAVGEDGVEMEAGESPDVTRNRVEAPIGDGFDIDCEGACSNGRVESNVVAGLPTTDAGFDLAVLNGLTGFSIARNTATKVGGPGYDLDLSNGTIQGNRVSRSGAADDNSFLLTGNNNVFSKNTADRNGGDGIVVDGDDNDLIDNLVERNQLRGSRC